MKLSCCSHRKPNHHNSGNGVALLYEKEQTLFDWSFHRTEKNRKYTFNKFDTGEVPLFCWSIIAIQKCSCIEGNRSKVNKEKPSDSDVQDKWKTVWNTNVPTAQYIISKYLRKFQTQSFSMKVKQFHTGTSVNRDCKKQLQHQHNDAPYNGLF